MPFNDGLHISAVQNGLSLCITCETQPVFLLLPALV